ncbi:MAG: hypothetical protein ABII06_02220 [Pseudomonadota bacterium]
MQRTLLVVVVLALTLWMSSCSSNEAEQPSVLPHIGEWVHEDAGGKGAKVLFRQDGTGILWFEDKNYPFQYVFDYSEKPVAVDLIYSREGKPYRAKVIVKFLDNNSLKWRTFFDDQRPDSFPEGDEKNTIILKRNPQKTAI